MTNNYLVVPMKIQVLFIENSVVKDYADTAWEMGTLKYADPTGSKVEPEPFSTVGSSSGKRLYEDGAYLHWIVPDAFTRGIVETDEMQFGGLCNAFKIYRSIRNSDGTVIDAPGNLKEFFVNNRKEEHLVSPVENGDPAYCANYEQCQKDFGCYDDLNDILSDGQDGLKDELSGFTGKLCYTVVGYYSDEKDDPLKEYASKHEDILGFLNERDLILFGYTGGVKADRLIWFGECFIDITDGKLQCANEIPRGEIGFAIGNSANDAFSAYIASKVTTDEAQKSRIEQKLHKLFNEIDSPRVYENYDFLTCDDTHGRGFLATNRGNKAALVTEDAGEEDKKNLAQLNLRLEEVNRLTAEYETMQEEAYIFWQSAAVASFFMEPSEEEKKQYNEIAAEYASVNEGYKQAILEKSKLVAEQAGALNGKYEFVGEERFWAPGDPCLLIAGEGLHNKFLQGFNGRETDDGENHFNQCIITSMELIDADFDRLCELEKEIGEAGYDFEWTDPWNPLFVEWMLSYVHEEKEEFLKNWELGICDLSYTGTDSGEKNDSLAIYSGRSIANPFMTDCASSVMDKLEKKLVERQKETEEKKEKAAEIEKENLRNNYSEEYQKELEFLDRMIPVVRELKDHFKTMDILVQPLSGFNEMLIGKKEAFVRDYRTSKVGEEFDKTMYEVYGDKTNYRKLEGDAFFPTRQGSARIDRIRIIDPFGRFVERSDNQIDLICSEEYSGSTKKNGFVLKPRIVVPARLQIKPAFSKPVFGWMVPNFLDNSVYVYDEDGRAVGYFYVYDGKILFRRMPLKDLMAEGEGNKELEEWIDGFLKNEKGEFLLNLLDYIDHAACSSPEAGEITDNATVIFDKKILALVKVEMDYELLGLEPQPIDTRLQKGMNEERERRIYQQFRLKLGGSGYSNDGLLLFYNGDHNGKVDYSSYKKCRLCGGNTCTEQDGRENETLFDTYGGTVSCTLLMEPAGEAVFVSGLLPSVKFRIPAEFVDEKVKNIQFCSEIGSFFTVTDDINIPLPVADNLKWTFLQPYWKKMKEDEQELHMIEKPVQNVMRNAERKTGQYMAVEGWRCVERQESKV